MFSKVFVFSLILVNVFANEEFQFEQDQSEPELGDRSTVEDTTEELKKFMNFKINLSTLPPLFGPGQTPILGPHLPVIPTPAPIHMPQLPPVVLPSIGQSINNIVHSVKQSGTPNLAVQEAPPNMELLEILKTAYHGCISLFEALIMMFNALFQSHGLLATDGLISLLLSPLGPTGIIGPHGILSQLLWWLFNKEGILGPAGLLSVVSKALLGCLHKLENEGLAAFGQKTIR